MSSTTRCVGLVSVKVGAVGGAGGMGSTLTTIEYIAEGSAVFAWAKPTATKLYNEDSDFPDVIIQGVSDKTIEFATRDVNGANFALALGGTGTTSAYTAPLTAVTVLEKSIEVVTKTINDKLLTIQLPRVSLMSGVDLKFSKTETGNINFAGELLLPTNGTTPPMTVTVST